jgi:hypothetical protein
MVAEELGVMIVHVDVPEYRQGFVDLQPEVVVAGIEAGWWALKKRMQINYNVELQALSRAIGRAEWLAMG